MKSKECRSAIHGWVAALVCLGCGPSHPVDEITISESRITVDQTGADANPSNDWPRWRGPTGDGQASPQSLPTHWEENKNIRWRAPIPGRGHSSPTIVGKHIYLATADDEAQTQSVIAFDREDGKSLWTRIIHRGGFPNPRDVHKKASNANGTIASDGARLYISFLNSDAITATSLNRNGDIVWQTELGKFTSRFGYAPSPVLYRSLVIFAADNVGGGYLVALDRTSGKVAWRFSRGTLDNYSSPALATVGGRDQLLISGCGAVTSYDPATGQQNWRTECIAKATCATVVTTDDRIFGSGGYPEKETVCLSADGEILWTDKVGVYEPSLIVVGNHLVGVSDKGVAYGWSIADGTQQWRERLGGNFSASPIVSNGIVYASNLSGETFVFGIDDGYHLISKNRLGDDCYASPAVSEGEVYLRIGIGKGDQRREQLVCIAEPTSARTNSDKSIE